MDKLIVLTLLIGNTAFGQIQKKALDPCFLLPLERSNVKGNPELHNLNMSRATSAWVGKFSHPTTNGSAVYILPPDRMLCVVPDQHLLEKMPTGGLSNRVMADGMPNAFPKMQIIPKEGEFR